MPPQGFGTSIIARQSALAPRPYVTKCLVSFWLEVLEFTQFSTFKLSTKDLAPALPVQAQVMSWIYCKYNNEGGSTMCRNSDLWKKNPTVVLTKYIIVLELPVTTNHEHSSWSYSRCKFLEIISNCCLSNTVNYIISNF